MKNVLLLAALSLAAYADNWPQWRGPNLNGISNEKNLPVRWTTTESVAWKLAMPSKTGATPIIWGNRVFLNVADGDDLYLWCVDKAKGTPGSETYPDRLFFLGGVDTIRGFLADAVVPQDFGDLIEKHVTNSKTHDAWKIDELNQ